MGGLLDTAEVDGFLGAGPAAAPVDLVAAWHEKWGDSWVTAADLWTDPELRKLAERHVPSGKVEGLGTYLRHRMASGAVRGLRLDRDRSGRWRVLED